SAAGLTGTNSVFFTVAKADQTITFNPLGARTYGDSPFGLAGTASSGLPVSFGAQSGPVSVSNSTASILGAGTATIPSSQPGDANYNAAAPVDRSFAVSAAGLSVTASNASRGYGQTNPVFGGSLVGVQNGDNITANYTTAATQGSPAGEYAITPSLLDPDLK